MSFLIYRLMISRMRNLMSSMVNGSQISSRPIMLMTLTQVLETQGRRKSADYSDEDCPSQ